MYRVPRIARTPTRPRASAPAPAPTRDAPGVFSSSEFTRPEGLRISLSEISPWAFPEKVYREYSDALARLHDMLDPSASTRDPRWNLLTPREREVAELLARGEKNGEIAKALGIGIKTVDTHRAHILFKLDLENNVALCRFMIREGRVTA